MKIRKGIARQSLLHDVNMTKFYAFVFKLTPKAEPEEVVSKVLYTKELAAINLISSFAIVEEGVKVNVAVESGSMINPACIDSVTTLQLTKEDKEAELKISLPLTPSILKYAVVLKLFSRLKFLAPEKSEVSVW